MIEGKVYLIGSGPGDPGLISIKALKILENADAVIYDRLVSKSIMNLIPKKVERIYAGKLSKPTAGLRKYIPIELRLNAKKL